MSGVKRLDLSEEDTASSNKKPRVTNDDNSGLALSSIAEFVAPFLDFVTLCTSFVLVDKSSHANFLQLRDMSAEAHARKHHPVLFLPTSGHSEDSFPFTFERYKQFISPKTRMLFGGGFVGELPRDSDGEYVPRRSDEYDMLMEIYEVCFQECEDTLVGYGAKRLDKFYIDSAEVNVQVPHFTVPHWEVCFLRVILRSRKDGKLLVLCHRLSLLDWAHQSKSPAHDGTTVSIFKDLCPKIRLEAKVTFERRWVGGHKTSGHRFDRETRTHTVDSEKTNIVLKFVYRNYLKDEYDTFELDNPNAVFEAILLENLHKFREEGLFV